MTTSPTNTDEIVRDADDGMPVDRCGRYTVVGRLGSGGMGIVLAAIDPVLGRKVALKLLRPRRGMTATQGAAQIELEGQAMAQLSHPNVVTVYEVDRAEGRTFVAMELVEGSTLRGWLKQGARPWREIVEMFVAAGRGLAAAHAAGLVHRDFKPDNVLIGHDGRPRVSDFGLCEASGFEDALVEGVPPGMDPTLRGTVVGTPAYMAPEQWAGGALDARSDQFAFCVALWEALWGQRPYIAPDAAELRKAIEAGAVVEPERRRVPRRVQAALRRGLAVDAAARWPDMPALLDLLVREARPRRWIVAAIATGAVAAAVVLAVVEAARGAPDPCPAPDARVAAVWGPVQRAELRAIVAAADPVRGAERFARIAAALDRGAQGFSAMHVEACRATRVEGRQSDTLLDQRSDCLGRWLGELGDTVAVIAKARDAGAVDHAVRAAGGLSSLDACVDARALSDATPLPADPARRATLIALVRRAQELEVEQRAGRLVGLPAQARALVAAARSADHAPTLAIALTVQARIDFEVSDAAEADATLRELAPVAARARDDRRVAFAWIRLIGELANEEGKANEALALVPTATAAVLRAGDPPDLRADLLYHRAAIVDEGPRPGDGLALLVAARGVLEQAGAQAPGSPLASQLADVVFETGTAHMHTGDADAAIASYRDAIARWRALYGMDSPDEARGWNNLGWVLQQKNRLDEALAAYRTAARICQARLGASTRTARALVAVASVLEDQNHPGEALPIYDQALAIDRAELGPDDMQLVKPLLGRALVFDSLARYDDEARDYDEVLRLYERTGARDIDMPTTYYNRGMLARLRGHCDDALRDHARAIALYEELRGPRTHFLIYPLVGQGMCLVHAGRAADAIAPLERALALTPEPMDAQQIVYARAYLGRARAETGRDVAGGLAMLRAARPALAADPDGKSFLRELDAWLAARK